MNEQTDKAWQVVPDEAPVGLGLILCNAYGEPAWRFSTVEKLWWAFANAMKSYHEAQDEIAKMKAQLDGDLFHRCEECGGEQREADDGWHCPLCEANGELERLRGIVLEVRVDISMMHNTASMNPPQYSVSATEPWLAKILGLLSREAAAQAGKENK